jgi:hypothetical protein
MKTESTQPMRIQFKTWTFRPVFAGIAAVAGVVLFSIVGCGDDSSSGDSAQTTTTEQPAAATEGDAQQDDGMAVSNRTSTLKKIFHAAPSPMETASLIQRSGAEFHREATNPTEKLKEYSTSDRQAIALGVYGADLSYATIFEENSAALDYLRTVKALAGSLGLSNVISDDVMKRASDNRNDRAALINIVSDTFYDLNEQLKSNGMEDLAGLVVASGWVEGVYLATRHLDEAPAELKGRIAEQKLTLDDVMRLCRSYEATPALTNMLEAMAPIEASYDAVTVTSGAASANQNETLIVIGGGPTFEADDAALGAIAAAVEKVRNGLVQVQ